MRIGVLGPLQVDVDGRPVELGGPVPRRLLAALVVHAGQVVSLDTLAEAAWGAAPPASAVKTIRSYVTRLRRALAGDRGARPGSVVEVIVTAPPGYRLVAAPEAIDAAVFAEHVRVARGALERGVPAEAERLLAEAFALWRGEPYAEFTDNGWFAAEAQRLAEIRLTGLEVRLAAVLALGRPGEVVADAQALCAAHPLHEQFWAYLVTALYGCGRQADALAALRQVRSTLAEEVGAEPGEELRSLEQRVLHQDPALLTPAHPVTPLPAGLEPVGLPFFGRVEDLAWLQGAWDAVAEDGCGRVAVISGPAGSGRSRLVSEFAVRLHGRGVPVRLGELGPGLSVLDDLDDEESVRLLADLPAGPVLCVATYDPATASPELCRALLDVAYEERVLAPLSDADIARIVARVTGPDGADLDEVVRAAHGWPGRAEYLAARMIEERSSRRVVAAVARAGPASKTLAAARDEVASGVRDLARLRVRQGLGGAGADRLACPYRGLARYEQADADLFHGREDLVAGLCARLVDTSFVAVVGPSGAGKSSVVRAGLLPALAAGVLPELATVGQYLLTPGDRLPEPDGAAVVVVDQFEEIFSPAVGEAERGGYLDGLTGLADRPATRVVVVLRSDFVGACAAYARLAELVGDGTVLVAAMRPEEIRRAIELPARHVGLRVEPALLDAVVSDMRDAPAALPLMSTALVQVWQARSGATLTAAAYHRAGGVPGALARQAEALLARLDDPARVAVRRILLRLAESGEGGVLVRRRVPQRELDTDPASARALAELISRRLVTAGDAGVEVTHEALLTHWPRLAGWLADDEQGRALRRHLAPAAAEWDATGRPDAELYRGARLASCLEWAAGRYADLTGVERDFLDASRAYAQRELTEETARADREARARRRLVAVLAAAVSLLLVAAGAAAVAANRQRAATQAADQAQAQRLGSLALVTPDLDRSLLLAVQAVRTHDDWETRGDLLAVLARSPQALRQVRDLGERGRLDHVALTPDGSTLVATEGEGGGRVLTWTAATLASTGPPTSLGMRAEAMTPGPDPSGVFISVAIDYIKGTQALVYWDARARRIVASYPLPAGVTGATRRAALSSDGRVLAVPTQDRLLLLYDRRTGRLRRRLPLPAAPGDVWAVGSLLVTTLADRPIAVFIDPTSGRIVRRMPLPFAGYVVVDPSGAALLVGAPDRAALVGIDDGGVIRQYTGSTRSGTVAAFSPDGTLLAIGGEDQLIGVWDVRTGQLRDTLRGHAAPVRGLVFSADGRTLFSAGRDNSVIAWDVAGSASFASRRSRTPLLRAPAVATGAGLTGLSIPTVGWSRDRHRALVIAGDGTAGALIDVASGQAIKTFPATTIDTLPATDVDRHAEFGSTGAGTLVRYDLSTGARTSVPAKPELLNEAVAVSADGRVLAVETAGVDAKGHSHETGVDVRDPATLAVRRHLPPLHGLPFTMWLNDDGSLLLATAFLDSHVELWDTRTGRRRWRVDIGSAYGNAFALSPDRRRLVVGTLGGAVVLLDMRTGRVLARHTLRLSAQIASAAYSPDGAVVAVGGNDGEIHLLTGDTLGEIGQLPIATGATWAFAAYSPDGSTLLAVDERGSVVSWSARPRSWMDRACSIAGRDLTPTEWSSYLPGVAHRRTCGTS